jgi:hypothetical protein
VSWPCQLHRQLLNSAGNMSEAASSWGTDVRCHAIICKLLDSTANIGRECKLPYFVPHSLHRTALSWSFVLKVWCTLEDIVTDFLKEFLGSASVNTVIVQQYRTLRFPRVRRWRHMARVRRGHVTSAVRSDVTHLQRVTSATVEEALFLREIRPEGLSWSEFRCQGSSSSS